MKIIYNYILWEKYMTSAVACFIVVFLLLLTSYFWFFFLTHVYLNKRDNVCDLVKLKILYPDFLIGSKWLNTMVKLKFSSSLKDLNIHRNIKEWSYLKIKSPYLKCLFNYLIWSFWFKKVRFTRLKDFPEAVCWKLFDLSL